MNSFVEILLASFASQVLLLFRRVTNFSLIGTWVTCVFKGLFLLISLYRITVWRKGNWDKMTFDRRNGERSYYYLVETLFGVRAEKILGIFNIETSKKLFKPIISLRLGLKYPVFFFFALNPNCSGFSPHNFIFFFFFPIWRHIPIPFSFVPFFTHGINLLITCSG